jgi:hypothetical protein
MSSPAPPQRPTPGRAVRRRTGPGRGTAAPLPRTAPPPETDPSQHAGARVAGRFRYEAGTDTWSWSPEMFAVLGLDPDTTEPGTEALVRHQAPTDRIRTVDALAAGRAFALEVRTQFGQRAVVLVGEPDVDPGGRVIAIEGLCAELSEGGGRVQELETEVEQLRAAMANRAVIEQAKGILMLLTSCRDQTAFDLLGHISSHTHRKVRDVAKAITESATGGARLPEEIRTILRDACPPTPHPP